MSTENSRKVAEYMAKLVHPLKPVIEEARSVLKQAEPDLAEHIKWNAPSFTYKEEDRITFNLHGKGFIRLIFHCGAKVKKVGGLRDKLEDPAGLLEWAAEDRAIVRLADMDDLRAKAAPLAALAVEWVRAADE